MIALSKNIFAIQASSKGESLESLRRKVSPFILRRMKKDVLSDLPPVSEIVYHCHLSEVQQRTLSLLCSIRHAKNCRNLSKKKDLIKFKSMFWPP